MSQSNACLIVLPLYNHCHLLLWLPCSSLWLVPFQWQSILISSGCLWHLLLLQICMHKVSHWPLTLFFLLPCRWEGWGWLPYHSACVYSCGNVSLTCHVSMSYSIQKTKTLGNSSCKWETFWFEACCFWRLVIALLCLSVQITVIRIITHSIFKHHKTQTQKIKSWLSSQVWTHENSCNALSCLLWLVQKKWKKFPLL